MRLTEGEIEHLQANTQGIRNICILAHVDHGKTSLSDSLLASNGIISQRMAGQIRYLDSRPDEQLRGITMESSAISLYFKTIHKSKEESEIKEYLINLIDSPGHVDFSSEVSIASRLCDGAIVLVDVVEGVCSQTVTVLRQCWVDKLKPVLVLNKIDRLITELQMTPAEAYIHLSKVIEQVNSVIGSFYAGKRMEDDYTREADDDNEEDEEDDSDIYFSPEKNNVIFASALDGWGFNIAQFSVIYEKKLGVPRERLQKVLWGDFYFDPKTKRVLKAKGLKGKNKRLNPMFVTFILNNIWFVYNVSVINRDQEKLEKIVKSLKIKVLPRELRSKDRKQLVKTIMGQWLSVATAVLLTVADKLPSPLESQQQRINTVLDTVPHSDLINKDLKSDMIDCNVKGKLSCYVSKMISIPEADLPENRQIALTGDELQEKGRQARLAASKAAKAAEMMEEAQKESNNIYDRVEESEITNEPEFEFEGEEPEEEEDNSEKEALIGFARIYSGTLSVGDEVSVLRPRFNPSTPEEHISKAKVTSLYLLMGRDLIPLKKAVAGNIVGVGGLDGHLLKSGTLVSPGVLGVNLATVSITPPPIVKVALEPDDPTKMDQLEKGLKLLNQADPCVQTYVEGTGEHILATAGELHLERCLKDLRERFAGISISASKPVIPYRETIVKEKDMKQPKFPELGRGTSQFTIGKYKITVRTVPLPEKAVSLLVNNTATIGEIMRGKQDTAEEDDIEEEVVNMPVDQFKKELGEALISGDKESVHWDSKLVDYIASFGPKHIGANILFDSPDHQLKRLFDEDKSRRFEYEFSIMGGFQLAMSGGPLASEPIQGTAVFLESIETLEEGKTQDENISGRLIPATKTMIHKGFLEWSPRLMLAMYTCDIQASTDVLGKVYAVVQKRRGTITKEELKEGTPFFTVTAKIPVVEAFGFSEEIRKRTSGAASPQLVFSGFESIDKDPFWVPRTEEELTELGEVADRENIARKYMNNIRRRKGLFVDEKVVKDAEKQRTLKKD